jgi:sugar phosphate isomerase/epimerase
MACQGTRTFEKARMQGETGSVIRLGTVVANRGHESTGTMRALAADGFESFEIAFKNTLAGTDLRRLADEAKAALDGTRAVVSSLGIYGNSLAADGHGDEVRSILRQMIALAPRFGTDVVCCFAGRVTDASIPDSIPRFREVFSRLAVEAEDAGIRIAFENCTQGGRWTTGDRNIAHNPAAWELMFEAVPSRALGLEWEPAHQLCQLIDPMPQLRAWAPRIFHLHGKDAEIRRDVLARAGCVGAERFAFHRFPGLGESNWAHIMSELVNAGFRGSIDIEGGHDPVYRGELEMRGQRFALDYLKRCRV